MKTSDEMKSPNRIWKVFIGITALLLLTGYYLVTSEQLLIIILLVLFALFTIVGITTGGISKMLLRNKAIRFIGGLSIEIYLCHMFVYRIYEKLNLIHMTENEMVNYCLIAVMTIVDAVAAAFCWSHFLKKMNIEKESQSMWRKR